MAETAAQAQNMFGDKPYQERARRALPILVRQARSRKPIWYEALATELGMPNPRNLNFVLGSVGTTLGQLARSKDWNEEIPHIQSLVINQQKRLPGTGFEGFLAGRVKSYASLTDAEKRAYLEGYWQDIYAYPYWDDVLQACELEPTNAAGSDLVEKAKTGKSGGGGEGKEHAALKEFVRTHPELVGLPVSFPHGKPEAPLPSGDRIDVLFQNHRRLLGVEVKAEISNDVDLVRGLFQCVKYKAVMEAERAFAGHSYRVDTILVIGRSLPDHLLPMKNSLSVEVLSITPDEMKKH